MKKLFSEVTIGNLTLKNRVVMAPMTRSRAINSIPNQLIATYYAQRSGAGLIVTEGTSPSPNGLGYSRIPGIFNQQQIDGWKLVTKAVHEAGSKIFVQLMHTGRVSHPANLPAGTEVLAPSAVKLETTKMWVDDGGLQEIPTPKAMTKEDIKHAIAEYVQAGKNAVEAGFDGVELHGANGYLIKQFLNPSSNIRTDEYGGTIENRSRFLLEAVKGIADAIGKDKVGIRLSPFGLSNETPVYPDAEATYDYISRELNNLEILYIHLVDHSMQNKQPIPETLTDKVRANFKGILILSGGYNADRAEAALQSGKGDLIAFGTSFLGNPDLVKRLEHNQPLNPLRFELFFSAGAEGLTDYPVFENAVLAK